MRNDLADVTLIVDRSGSMCSCKEQAEKGANDFIREQKAAGGDCTFTMIQFDHQYDCVHDAVPVKDVNEFDLIPRGSTALYDAVGRAITEAGARLEDMAEADRPGLVTFVIVTDGEENASRLYRGDKVAEMIKHQDEKYNWKFTYLGANHNAFKAALSLGIGSSATAQYTGLLAHKAFRAASQNVLRMRASGLDGEEITCCYTGEERKAMA